MRRLPGILAIVLVLAAGPAAAQLDCSGQTEVQLGGVYDGDTASRLNNVTSYGCSDWTESGGEAVFHLFLASPRLFEVSLTSECDLDLAILIDCDAQLGCVEVTDDGAASSSPQQGDFWFVVDGYQGAACVFELAVIDGGVGNESMTFGQVKTLFWPNRP